MQDDQTSDDPPWIMPDPEDYRATVAELTRAANPQRFNSTALAGFIIACIGLSSAWVPFVGIFGAIIAALGGILCIFGALIASTRGGSGMGFAVAGMAVAVLSVCFVVWWHVRTNEVLQQMEKLQRQQSKAPAR